MRIALFAADAVGLQIAQFIGAQSEPPACLVLDARDRGRLNEPIMQAAAVCESATILTDAASRGQLAAQLARYQPDLCVLAWWPYILKPDVLAVPTLGCLNFHPSLLPHGRGKAPNFWALSEGTPFGVTIHWVDDGIDSGPIAFQRQIPVGWEDTGKTLYEKSRFELVNLFKQSWPDIRSGRIPRIPQPNTFVCRYQRELDAASQINLDGPATGRDVLNKIRARTFDPHPAAWFEEDGQRYEVRVSISQIKDQANDARAIRRA